MQVIEKVKVVPEGYNGAGMDGYGRRDVNGKANAGLVGRNANGCLPCGFTQTASTPAT